MAVLWHTFLTGVWTPADLHACQLEDNRCILSPKKSAIAFVFMINVNKYFCVLKKIYYDILFKYIYIYTDKLQLNIIEC